MDCERIREAISAQIDDEDTGLPGQVVDAHLADCDACREWRQRAHGVTRRVRVGGPVREHDLTVAVLAAVPATLGDRRWRIAQRAGLAAAAAAQLAITAPMLLLGHEHDAGAHAAHELGAFNLALGIAFVLGALRPRLSAGLGWPSCVAAAGLLGTALADLAGGQTLGVDELPHLAVVAGAVLLVWQARTARHDATGPAAAGHPEFRPAVGTAGVPTAGNTALRLEGAPRPPGGGTSVAKDSSPGAAA
jgi:predicted anti-sigma-YlaC factor YlaD